jgi:hypothetical protein
MSLQVKWYGDKIKGLSRAGAAEGLFRAAEEVRRLAVDLCPKEEGTLRGDSLPSVDESALRAAVSFGLGPAAAYAVRQHEDMSYHHIEGQAKFLETPLNSEGPRILKAIAAGIRKKLT